MSQIEDKCRLNEIVTCTSLEVCHITDKGLSLNFISGKGYTWVIFELILFFTQKKRKVMNSWDDLLYTIRKGRCVLVLGSGVSTGQDDVGMERPLTEILAHRLCDQMERQNIMVEGNRNNLFQVANEFVDHFGHTALERETEDFLPAKRILPAQRLAERFSGPAFSPDPQRGAR